MKRLVVMLPGIGVISLFTMLGGVSAAGLRAGAAAPDDLIGGSEESPNYHPPKANPEDMKSQSRAYARRAAAKATEARAAGSKARGETAAGKAADAAAATNAQLEKNMPDYPPVKENMEAVKKQLALALAEEEKVKKLYEEAKKIAYDTAKAEAEKKVKQLEKEAQEYWEALLAKLAALANKPEDAAGAAAAKAAMPYFKLALRTGELVAFYTLQSEQLVAAAKQMVKLAFNLAQGANIKQANGFSKEALQDMIQAHGLVRDANLKEGQAKKIYKLAQSLNSSIAAYKVAAEQMAVHVMATFSGLQLGAKTRRKNPFGKGAALGADAQAAETIHIAEVTDGKADEALRQCGADLEELSKSLQAANKQLEKH